MSDSSTTPPPTNGESITEDQFKSLSRRAFLTFGAGAVAGLGGLWWLSVRPKEDGVAGPLRGVLGIDEKVAETFYRPSRLAPIYPASAAEDLRVNGKEGLGDDFDADSWKLRLIGPGGEHSFTLEELQKLPRTELTTETRCVEGWTVVASWAGVRMLDLLEKYPIHQSLPYVNLFTPDQGYSVGIDTPSAIHPQTLLAYEMNGDALTPEHGAPLRLVIPVKYGLKWLKRIGTIRFTDVRLDDFWTQRGYDWFAGL
jgi:hypothetical protein